MKGKQLQEMMDGVEKTEREEEKGREIGEENEHREIVERKEKER